MVETRRTLPLVLLREEVDKGWYSAFINGYGSGEGGVKGLLRIPSRCPAGGDFNDPGYDLLRVVARRRIQRSEVPRFGSDSGLISVVYDRGNHKDPACYNL